MVHITEDGSHVHSWPTGKWRHCFQRYGHFVLIAARSETDYLVKSTASLMPYSEFHFEHSHELYFPDASNLSQVLNAAINYVKVEWNEAHRREVEALLH